MMRTSGKVVVIASAFKMALFCSLLQFTASAEIPFSAIRLRKPQTDSQKIWNATLDQFRKYRAGVDDVWFSTGINYPAMKEHRENAARLAKASGELRAIGILPSLQIQATLGHGDAIISFSARAPPEKPRLI